MHPELFRVPFVGITVKTYSFCLMIGFLTAVWFAMRRADRVKASAERVLGMSFLSLIFGVGGARLFFVVHYWQAQFADAPNKFFAIIDIRQGGLEFLGGLLGAVAAALVYLVVTKQSMRLYLDIMAPGAMWGLAFGRIGCFFNGCCFGGLCVVAGTAEPAHDWAVQFPFGSPAQTRHWEDRHVTVPAELISGNSAFPYLIAASALELSPEIVQLPKRRVEMIKTAISDSSEGTTARKQQLADHLTTADELLDASLDSNHIAAPDAPLAGRPPPSPDRQTSQTELQDLAAGARSLPIHPTQLYAAIHAFALCGLLTAVLYRRKRHGLVIGLMFLLYPIGRVILETIRVDNPHDSAGLTVSQFLGIVLFMSAAVYLFVLYTKMPVRSPSLHPGLAADRPRSPYSA